MMTPKKRARMSGYICNKYDNSKVNGAIIKGLYEIRMQDCYDVKDQLKALGYEWNSYNRSWCLTCTAQELGNAIADVVVAIDLPAQAYNQMVYDLEELDIDLSAVSMDAAHTAKLTAHYAARN